MKSIKGSIGRSVDEPDPKVRFYLFHGTDESQSSALGDRLVGDVGKSEWMGVGQLQQARRFPELAGDRHDGTFTGACVQQCFYRRDYLFARRLNPDDLP